jgi:hypothetical protein
MHLPSRPTRAASVRAAALAVPAALAVLLFTGTTAYADVALTQVSSDPYTDTQAQHRSEVEPDTYSFGASHASRPVARLEWCPRCPTDRWYPSGTPPHDRGGASGNRGDP